MFIEHFCPTRNNVRPGNAYVTILSEGLGSGQIWVTVESGLGSCWASGWASGRVGPQSGRDSLMRESESGSSVHNAEQHRLVVPVNELHPPSLLCTDSCYWNPVSNHLAGIPLSDSVASSIW